MFMRVYGFRMMASLPTFHAKYMMNNHYLDAWTGYGGPSFSLYIAFVLHHLSFLMDQSFKIFMLQNYKTTTTWSIIYEGYSESKSIYFRQLM
jgi:hypothetical protein